MTCVQPIYLGTSLPHASGGLYRQPQLAALTEGDLARLQWHPMKHTGHPDFVIRIPQQRIAPAIDVEQCDAFVPGGIIIIDVTVDYGPIGLPTRPEIVT